MNEQGDTMPVIGHCQHNRHPERCFYCLRAEAERLRAALLAIARVPHSGGDSSECARERGRLARLALR